MLCCCSTAFKAGHHVAKSASWHGIDASRSGWEAVGIYEDAGISGAKGGRSAPASIGCSGMPLALNVLAYNVKRVIAALGCRPLLEAMHTSAPGGSLNAQMSQEIACDGCRGPHAFNRLKRSRRARRSKQTRR